MLSVRSNAFAKLRVIGSALSAALAFQTGRLSRDEFLEVLIGSTEVTEDAAPSFVEDEAA